MSLRHLITVALLLLAPASLGAWEIPLEDSVARVHFHRPGGLWLRCQKPARGKQTCAVVTLRGKTVAQVASAVAPGWEELTPAAARQVRVVARQQGRRTELELSRPGPKPPPPLTLGFTAPERKEYVLDCTPLLCACGGYHDCNILISACIEAGASWKCLEYDDQGGCILGRCI